MRLYYYTCLDPKMCPASSPKAYQQLGELDLPGPELGNGEEGRMKAMFHGSQT